MFHTKRKLDYQYGVPMNVDRTSRPALHSADTPKSAVINYLKQCTEFFSASSKNYSKAAGIFRKYKTHKFFNPYFREGKHHLSD